MKLAMGFAIDRHNPPGPVADDPYSKVLPLRRVQAFTQPCRENRIPGGAFLLRQRRRKRISLASHAARRSSVPLRETTPMAEADVPAPGSDQIETPQTAPAEQHPSPASTEHPKGIETPQPAPAEQHPSPASTEHPEDIETPQTAPAEQHPSPAPTDHPKPEEKAKAPREGRKWKRLRYAGAALGTLALAAGLSVYLGLGTEAGPGRGHGQKPDAPLGDSHSRAKSDEKNPLADRSMRLMQFRREAEEALILARFYEDEGATDKLRKCLEALTRWKQEEIAIHGEPRFADADGLVTTRTQEETLEKDFWERVTSAIQRLGQRLH